MFLDIAKTWERDFGENLLSGESVSWLDAQLSEQVKKLGYARFESENELMAEYIATHDMQLTKIVCSAKVHRIYSNAVLQKLCEASGCDIEIADDGEDVIFAVVENGRILAYAGMNDVLYNDGSVEISVETAPDERRKGYGISCVYELLKYLLDKGICVRYKCALSNCASSALAEKCGFELEGIRFSYVCERIYADA